jgi:hypothetical protein
MMEEIVNEEEEEEERKVMMEFFRKSTPLKYIGNRRIVKTLL